MIAPVEYHIDCYGRSYGGDVTVDLGAARLLFAFTDQAKSDARFGIGLFLDETIVSRAPYRYPAARRIAVLLETPIKAFYGSPDPLVRTFARVFTFDAELLRRGSPFELLTYGMSWIPAAGQDGWQPGRKDRLLSFIGSIDHGDDHGYGVRKEVARRLVARPGVDCYGRGVREIESKLEGLERYAFSVAMENVRRDYYFTEKLIDCFLTETVPLYWGCPGIDRFFDARGLIPFADVQQLLEVVEGLTWERYERILPFVRENKQRVIANRWHTREGLYGRLGRLLLENCQLLHPLPRYRRTKLGAAARWLRAVMLT